MARGNKDKGISINSSTGMTQENFDKKDFTQTLSKEVNKDLKQGLIINKLKKLKSSKEYILYNDVVKKKVSIDKLISLKRQEFREKKGSEFISKNRFEALQSQARKLQFEINDKKPIVIEIRSLETTLRELSEDTRLKFFLEVCKGYFDKETFLKIYGQSQILYEEYISEKMKKSSYEILNES